MIFKVHFFKILNILVTFKIKKILNALIHFVIYWNIIVPLKDGCNRVGSFTVNFFIKIQDSALLKSLLTHKLNKEPLLGWNGDMLHVLLFC